MSATQQVPRTVRFKEPEKPSSSSSSPRSRTSSSSSNASFSSSPFRLSPLPTTVYVNIPQERDYSPLLQQTEIVYDQLLAERERKLEGKIRQRQQQYDEKYGELVRTDQVKADEFRRWAAAALKQLKDESLKELEALREDYEAKFVKMKISLEERWMAEHGYHTIHLPSQQQQQQHQQQQQWKPLPHHHHQQQQQQQQMLQGPFQNSLTSYHP